jgi:ParB-like chromosome segregation protein Spo0J
LDTIKASLTRFGQQKPIVVDSKGIILAGNGTFQAALEMGWTEIDIVKTPLDGAMAQAYAIADNRSAELAEWDYKGLSAVLRGLGENGINLEELGWAQHELEPLMKGDWTPPSLDETGEGERPIGRSLFVTEEQWITILRALTKIRLSEDGGEMKDGRGLELICADWLSGQ